jgi:hypothetical protein
VTDNYWALNDGSDDEEEEEDEESEDLEDDINECNPFVALDTDPS